MIKPALLAVFIMAVSLPASVLPAFAGEAENNGLASSSTISPNAISPSVSSPVVLTNPLAELSLSTFDETRKRPLFSPARRPKPVTVAPTRAVSVMEPPPPEPPSLVLLAVLSDERGSHAIIRPSPSEKPRNIKIGDDIAGWRVSEIEPRRMVLVQAERRSDFTLFESRTKPTKAVVIEKGRRSH